MLTLLILTLSVWECFVGLSYVIRPVDRSVSKVDFPALSNPKKTILAFFLKKPKEWSRFLKKSIIALMFYIF